MGGIKLDRDWFLWAFDKAMQDAVFLHGDAARLTAYEARQSFSQILPEGIVGTVEERPTTLSPVDRQRVPHSGGWAE